MDNLRGVRVGIIGAGAIGGALIDRLLSGAGVGNTDVLACEPKQERREEIAQRYGVRVSADPAAAGASDIVVLAAPPLEIKKILQALTAGIQHRPLIVSFAGAISIDLLETALPPSTPVVRVNPNSPLIVGAGYNPVVYGSSTTGAARALAERFLRVLGKSPIVEDAQMNLYTAITAVGPTYFLPVFDAMISAAVDGGLSRDAAITATIETALGSAQMVAARTEDPEQLKLFTGLRPLQDTAVRDLVRKAISEAAARMEAVQKQASS